MLNRFTSLPSKLRLFEELSVAVTDAALEATDGGMVEPERDSSWPRCRDAASCSNGVECPRDMSGRCSWSLLNRPRKVFRRLLNLRGGCVLSGSDARCTADVDCDNGDGTVVLCRRPEGLLIRLGRTGKVGLYRRRVSWRQAIARCYSPLENQVVHDPYSCPHHMATGRAS